MSNTNVDTLKLLGSLLGNSAVSKGSGANILQTVLGAAMGGNASQGGGGLLGAVLGGQQPAAQPQGQHSVNYRDQPQANQGGGLAELLKSTGLGGLLGAAMGQYGQSQQPNAAPTRADHCDHLPQDVSHTQASNQATTFIRAMINAAKSDGQFDQQEQQAILGRLGDISQDEINFIRHELAQPLDVNAFVRSVPRGLEQQVYAMSLLAINLDQNKEAQYLHQLAQGLGISPQVSNQIHQQMGAPVLYS